MHNNARELFFENMGAKKPADTSFLIANSGGEGSSTPPANPVLPDKNLMIDKMSAKKMADSSFYFTPNSGEGSESLLINTVNSSASQNSVLSDDNSFKVNMKSFLQYASPILLAIKYAAFFVIFVLSAYVLVQCTEYFKEAKQQQDEMREELNTFHITAEHSLTQLERLQGQMEDKIENINVLTELGAQRIKDMFSFSKSDLMKDYAEEDGAKCDYIPLNLRFDCHPENGASQLSCTDRGCCWNPLHQLNYEKNVPLDVPYCYYPKNWTLYKYDNFTKDGNDFSGFLKLQKNSFYKSDVPLVKIESFGVDDTTLRVKIFDPVNKRYEPPYPIREDPHPFSKENNNPQYEFKMDENIPGFKVMRSNDQKTIFNSIGFGGFIFADQFLQISSVLPSSNIYGLGEHRTNLKLNTNWQKLTLFNADQPPTENANLYGSHPFYMVVEKSGKTHGMLFMNSNAMDIILQPTPAITIRSIGGIFDMYFFMGPTPADVLKQYAQVVGKPFLPPYWSLGFHLCKFGYKSLEETRSVWKRTRDALIPFDTQWNDLDYMDKNNDFTYDKIKFKDLPKFVKEIHDAGMHYIPLIDAGVSALEESGYVPYDEGVKLGIFVIDENNNVPFKGKVWNLNSTTWPDFTHPKTSAYYSEMMSNMHKDFEYDGAWIDMNEPSNFYNGHLNGCDFNNSLNTPPYLPNVVGNLLTRKTLCMNARQHLGYHYDLHNVYGTSQAIVVNSALKQIRNKRPFIISRSTWEGHGSYAGHWTGDIYSSWHDLRMSIPEILAYSLFQIPMVGADICGFDGNATEALCNRWMQLGAFYPFSRNHNSDDTTEQDPVSMGQLVVMSSKKALNARYYLLPYLYTLFYRAHKYAETVARPLFVEFPEDPNTFDIDTEFLWGSCLLIVPVLKENETYVNTYLPRGPWYNFYTKEYSNSIGSNYTLDAPIDTIPLLVRGGCILPVQEPSTTTTLSRQKPFGLFIALDERERATGELYWDDGDSLDSIEKKQYLLFSFNVSDDTLTCYTVEGSYGGKMKLGKITIMGVTKIVQQVFLNENDVKFVYDKELLVLEIDNLFVDFSKKFVLRWSDRKIETHEPTTAVPIKIHKTSLSNENIIHAVHSGTSINRITIFEVFGLSLISLLAYKYHVILV